MQRKNIKISLKKLKKYDTIKENKLKERIGKMTAFELLCKIIASEVMGEDTLSGLEKELDESLICELYEVAKTFDMAHLCGSAFKKIKPSVSKEVLAPFYNDFAVSVFRNRRLCDELRQISELFESEGIDHIALKGSVIRFLYPEAWMRTSCDIDVLVKKEQLNSARTALEQKLEYKYLAYWTHDLSFESPTGVHIELHFYLLEDSNSLSLQSETIGNIWDKVAVAEGKSHTFIMSDAAFYFYNLAHMAKHFLSGGCGVKPFVDLWVLENRVDFDSAEREKLVSDGGLAPFCDAAHRLMKVWFFGAEYAEEDRLFEKYILRGGIYGTVENKVRVGLAKSRNRFLYILSRIFPSYKTMKKLYPLLGRHKIFLPICHIKRWCRVIFQGGIKRAKFQISKSSNLDRGEINETESLLSLLGFSVEKRQ